MEPRAFRLLELDKILHRLEESASSALGRALVRELRPSSEPVEVRRRLTETSQARAFLDAGKTPPFGGLTDISTDLRHAAVGSMLDARRLLAVAHLAAGSRRLRESVLGTEQEVFSLLHHYAGAITPRPDLEKAISAAIDDATEEVKDDASLKLLRARRNMRRTQGDIQARLRQMLADPNLQPLLQDNFVTVRDGRYCLPVKAESRSRVPGIVHDRSGSGGAFFVEPQAVVEMNNRLRELLIEEREAIAEILTALTGRVGEAHDDLASSQTAAGRLDFAFAKARLSLGMNAVEPVVEAPTARSGFALRQARHPLVENCVPNDIFLGDGSSVCGGGTDQDFDVILITGPNTGGKTVVLKTLGLLTCMAGCGLHLPVAAGSWLAVPGAVYADIGDEQSIEQSLSTFSSHVKQIVDILKRAQVRDLVLLDEVGAGTDPDEGAALAKAVLRTLQRRGVRVVATTHYGELKQFALGAERFENASVEFNARTLQPTYHLRIGVPGASNALDIAARLGMPPELVQRARRYLGRDRVEAEAAVQRLEETQRELEQQTASTQRERGEAERLRQDYEARLARLQEQIERARADARRTAEELVRQTQDEADSILRELRSAARESKRTEEARHRLRTLRQRVDLEQQTAAARPVSNGAGGSGALSAGAVHSATPAAAPAEEHVPSIIPARTVPVKAFPAVGDMVQVINLNKEGVLLSAPNAQGRVAVRVGAIRVEVPAANIATAPRPGTTSGGATALHLRKAVTVPEELFLIGKTVDEALEELEKYLDDALLAGVAAVRIVHGRGTGALRKGLHRWLKAHRAVREFHLAPNNEGGEGATIVALGTEA